MAQPTDNKVSLGCGTLILIALIVIIFSRSGDEKRALREIRQLRNEVRNLSNQASAVPSGSLQESVDALKRSVDAQSAQIEDLKSEVSQMRGKMDAASSPVTPPVEGE